MFFTTKELAQHIKLSHPLDKMDVSQAFGVNTVYPGFYKKIGIENDLHNGLDFNCPTGTPCYAVCDGMVLTGVGGTTGMMIELTSNEYVINGQKIQLKIRYLHLKEFKVKNGDVVKAGQLMGITDNTGYSTAPHLHFDIVPRYWNGLDWIADITNGFKGRIDPMPLLQSPISPDSSFIASLEGKVILRTELHGEAYLIEDKKLIYLSTEKDPITKHIPLVDYCLHILKSQGRLRAITENEFNKLKS